MEYIRLFENHSEYEVFTATTEFVRPNISTCKKENDMHYNPTPHNYSKDYLTFVALENGTFTFSENTIQYSMDDGGSWVELAPNTQSPIVKVGKKIMWKQSGLTPTSGAGIGTFSSTSNFDVQGNIMSLYYGDNFKNQTDLSGKDYAFKSLFSGNTKAVSAENLVLPATTLANWCYTSMFSNCSSLTIAPELPTTTLSTYCYSYMFKGCTSLTVAPELPATTLASGCYQHMFNGCASLTTAPELLATTLVLYCYAAMFSNCTSLNYIKAMFTTKPGAAYTSSWVNGVASSGTFVKNSAASWDVSGVNGIPSGWTVQNPKDYLTFVALEDGTFTLTIGSAVTTSILESISYSLDDGETWTATNNVDNQTITITTPTVSANEKVLWKGIGVGVSTTTDNNNIPSTSSIFSSSGKFNVEGNIMSLLYGDDFKNQTSLSGKDYAFRNLFSGNTKVVSAENLVLPATTLASSCYRGMFFGCTSLTTAPKLQATTLANSCYGSMFRNCTSLTTAPELPATTLATECYSYMFYGCTNLKTAPELPATTLATECYSFMFSNCSSLTKAPELLATTLTDYCYQNMFQGCTSLTTAPELPATTLTSSCYNSMFYGCESLTTAPKLQATTLASSCYKEMLYGCTSLTTAPKLPATTLASNCYTSMFEGCTSLTTAPELPATTLASSCYNSMFQGCTSLTTAPELPATTLATYCYGDMFFGCTSLTTAPELPATTLASYCYYYMFQGCTSLNSITCLATDISASYCTSNWVTSVASSGTFKKAASMASWTNGINGIPIGWTVQNA